MKNIIKDLAASGAVSWGTIAKKIDENFSELENSIPEVGEEGYTAEIDLITPNFNAVLKDTTGNYIEFTFDIKNENGNSIGENITCMYTFVRGANKRIITESYRYNTHVKFNIDKYLEEGTNVITVKIAGNATTVETSVIVTYEVINISVIDYLDISNVYNLNNNNTAYLEIPYDISGSYTKLMEWYIDGVKLETVRNEDEVLDTVPTSRVKTIEISNLSQGRHNLQFRASSKINGDIFYSDTLYRDFFVYTDANYDFMIGVGTTIPASYGIMVGDLMIPNMIQYVGY